MTNFNELERGCIYLVKGTLNQFAYEVNKLNNVSVIIDPDWDDIQQTISNPSIFIEHVYYAINGNSHNKIPTNLYINNNKCHTLFILVSDFSGELTEYKKLFKSCHAPYYSLDILSKDYIINKNLDTELTPEAKRYLNLNPKLNTETYIINNLDNETIDIAYIINSGKLDFWCKSNRQLFYRYLITNNSCKYNYAPLSKPPYNIPTALWIIFIIYCKEKTKVYNLHPEYLLKIFSVWVYLTSTYYVTPLQNGFSNFINRKDRKRYYSFATSEEALKSLKNIIKKC